MAAIFIFLILICFFSPLTISTDQTASDKITPTRPLRAGESIVSAGQTFELGFFSPKKDSTIKYLGIWYNKIGSNTVVWVANRDTPLNGSSADVVLKLSEQGVLSLSNDVNASVWSTNSSGPAAAINKGPVVAKILDTGNLVVKNDDDNNPENYLWQSFDYPSDTLLPGMKYGINLNSGLNRGLRAWTSEEDPTSGAYTNQMNPSGLPEFLLKKGTVTQFRSGPWNGLRFSGMPNLKPNQIYAYEFVFTDTEVYYTYKLLNTSVVTRLVLSPNGILQRYTWIERTRVWSLYLNAQTDNCDRYALCGAYGICNINNSPPCSCLIGFVPKSKQDWNSGDWSQGCVRKTKLDCPARDGFRRYPGLKLPDTSRSWYNKTMDLRECEQKCLRNCSCTAYSNLDVRAGGSGCLLWSVELLDIRQYTADSGQDIYIRIAESDLEQYGSSKRMRVIKTIVVPIVVVFGVSLLGSFAIWHFLNKKRKNKPWVTREASIVRSLDLEPTDENRNEDLELPLFGFSVIAEATDNFSSENKIGQGGFGPVYKGVLKEGQEIAVKRLSKTSRQGVDEFKNEVFCIAKLQHRNLVRLLGCCIEAEERLLIYEYLPNKSLNFIIFDGKHSMLLNWPKRFNIINGIARGLLYLHQDSILRIVHRDLKASNVLLDHEMNPKISDFGMARGFGGDETGANTSRVVGTYGYMSPEYTIDGIFSVKSDVFSFGVLVLEIISGKKNRGFRHPQHRLNLLGHAWMLHREGDPLELVDILHRRSCNISEVLRSIHVALLCVQRGPEDRPNMSTVVLMLSSEIALPEPKEPGFFSERDLSDSDCSTTVYQKSTTINKLTISTMLMGR